MIFGNLFILTISGKRERTPLFDVAFKGRLFLISSHLRRDSFRYRLIWGELFEWDFLEQTPKYIFLDLSKRLYVTAGIGQRNITLKQTTFLFNISHAPEALFARYLVTPK